MEDLFRAAAATVYHVKKRAQPCNTENSNPKKGACPTLPQPPKIQSCNDSVTRPMEDNDLIHHSVGFLLRPFFCACHAASLHHLYVHRPPCHRILCCSTVFLRSAAFFQPSSCCFGLQKGYASFIYFPHALHVVREVPCLFSSSMQLLSIAGPEHKVHHCHSRPDVLLSPDLFCYPPPPPKGTLCSSYSGCKDLFGYQM